MTKERMMKAAARRGIYTNGEKRWRNTMVGYAYELSIGWRWAQCETLEQCYRIIQEYKIDKDAAENWAPVKLR